MLARLTLLVPLLIAMPVCAGQSVEVRHGDLNLVSAAGQATLERRIDAAVDQVCSIGNEPSLALRASMQKCSAEVRAAAMSQMQVAVARATLASQLAANGGAPSAQTSALR